MKQAEIFVPDAALEIVDDRGDARDSRSFTLFVGVSQPDASCALTGRARLRSSCTFDRTAFQRFGRVYLWKSALYRFKGEYRRGGGLAVAPARAWWRHSLNLGEALEFPHGALWCSRRGVVHYDTALGRGKRRADVCRPLLHRRAYQGRRLSSGSCPALMPDTARIGCDTLYLSVARATAWRARFRSRIAFNGRLDINGER